MKIANLCGYSLAKLADEWLSYEPDKNIHQMPGLSTPFLNITQKNWSEAVALWNNNAAEIIPQLLARCCPVCSSESYRCLFNTYDGYPYVECHECACWYIPLVIDASVFESFFEKCLAAKELVQHSYTKRQSSENIEWDLKRIGENIEILLPLLPSIEKKYLDVGCGLGHSLQAAKNLGMQARGIDTSIASILIGRQNGLDIREKLADFSDEKFHLISFWESLEHMVSPGDLLLQCLPLLEEDGLLAFTVPNQHSPLVRLQRGDCCFVNGGFDTPGHINLMSPSNLELLLDNNGYVLLDLDAQYGLNLREFVSYFLGKNRGAYDLLKGLPVDSMLSTPAEIVINAIGPIVSKLERMTLTAPILFGFACKKESEERFTEVIKDFKANRNAQLRAEVKEMTSSFEVKNSQFYMDDALSQNQSLQFKMDEVLSQNQDLQSSLSEVLHSQSYMSDIISQNQNQNLQFKLDEVFSQNQDLQSSLSEVLNSQSCMNDILSKNQSLQFKLDEVLSQNQDLQSSLSEVLHSQSCMNDILSKNQRLQSQYNALYSEKVRAYVMRKVSYLLSKLSQKLKKRIRNTNMTPSQE